MPVIHIIISYWCTAPQGFVMSSNCCILTSECPTEPSQYSIMMWVWSFFYLTVLHYVLTFVNCDVTMCHCPLRMKHCDITMLYHDNTMLHCAITKISDITMCCSPSQHLIVPFNALFAIIMLHSCLIIICCTNLMLNYNISMPYCFIVIFPCGIIFIIALSYGMWHLMSQYCIFTSLYSIVILWWSLILFWWHSWLMWCHKLVFRHKQFSMVRSQCCIVVSHWKLL